MGTWGKAIFDDDLALDIRGAFTDAVQAGEAPGVVASSLMDTELAREILEESVEDEWDEAFWEESGSLFFAVATLQLEEGVLSRDVKRQTLRAIEAWQDIAEGDDEKLEVLDGLRQRLLRG